MNLEYENLIKKINIFLKKKKNPVKIKKTSTVQNNSHPIIKPNNELQRVYSILEKKLEEDINNKLLSNNLNFQKEKVDKSNRRMGLMKKKVDKN